MQQPTSAILDRLPTGGWAVLLVVVLGIVVSAGVQVLRLVLEEKRHRQAREDDGFGCRLDQQLISAMRLGLDRQPAYALDAAQAHRDLESALVRMTDALTRLTILTERLIDEARERRG